MHPRSIVQMNHNTRFLFLNYISNFFASCIADIITKNELILIMTFLPNIIQLQITTSITLWSYDVHRIVLKSIDICCGFSPCHIISITCFCLNYDKELCLRKRIDLNLTRVSCVDFLVGNNTTNQSVIGNFNGCLYLVLELLDIFDLICGA